MIADVKEFKDLEFFKEFDDKTIQQLIGIGEIKDFHVKEVVISEDQELHEFCVIIEGSVLIGITVSNKGRITIGTIYSGHIFSWSALFPPHIATAQVTANVPARIMVFDEKKLQAMIDKDPVFGYKLMRFISSTLSRRLHDTRNQLVNMAII